MPSSNTDHSRQLEIRRPASGEGQALLLYFRTLFNESSEFLNYPGDYYDQQSHEEQEKFIVTALEEKKFFTVFAYDEEKVVGHALLQRFPYPFGAHSASLVIGVLKEYQEKGVGSQLLSRLLSIAMCQNVSHIELRVRTHNSAAIALYEKFCFRRVGLIENAAKINNQFHHEYLYYLNLTLNTNQSN